MRNSVSDDDDPAEIIYAKNWARVSLVLSALCASVAIWFSGLDYSWIFVVMWGSLVGFSTWNSGYAVGYRRGMCAGISWCDALRRTSIGKRSAEVLPPKDQLSP